MANDEQTEEARQRALHLAAEVAETDDSNVTVLLLQLKGNLHFNLYRNLFGIDQQVVEIVNQIRLQLSLLCIFVYKSSWVAEG